MMNMDERIKKDVVDSLCANDYFDASSIAVKVKNGVVEMTGSVPSNEERELAGRIVKRISQVGDIQNHLVVIEESGEDPKSHIA